MFHIAPTYCLCKFTLVNKCAIMDIFRFLKDLFDVVYLIRDTCITTILQNLGRKYFNTLGPHWPVDMNYDTVYVKSIWFLLLIFVFIIHGINCTHCVNACYYPRLSKFNLT